MKIDIVQASPSDIPEILRFIRELARFEKLEHEMVATPELIREHLFGEHPAAEVIFIREEGVKVGFALFFTSFSTFLGQPGIYLEDLFVLPEYRGRGYGKKLLAHLAKLTVTRKFGRLEWSVLDWNESAIRLYRSIGAKPMDEWTVQRLTDQALERLAQGG